MLCEWKDAIDFVLLVWHSSRSYLLKAEEKATKIAKVLQNDRTVSLEWGFVGAQLAQRKVRVSLFLFLNRTTVYSYFILNIETVVSVKMFFVDFIARKYIAREKKMCRFDFSCKHTSHLYWENEYSIRKRREQNDSKILFD